MVIFFLIHAESCFDLPNFKVIPIESNTVGNQGNYCETNIWLLSLSSLGMIGSNWKNTQPSNDLFIWYHLWVAKYVKTIVCWKKLKKKSSKHISILGMH